MTVAAISCTFVPLGTILGAFTIAALLKPEIKEQFTKPQQKKLYKPGKKYVPPASHLYKMLYNRHKRKCA